MHRYEWIAEHKGEVKYKAYKFAGQLFVLAEGKRMASRYPGTSSLSGVRFEAGTEIYYARHPFYGNGRHGTLVAPADEVDDLLAVAGEPEAPEAMEITATIADGYGKGEAYIEGEAKALVKDALVAIGVDRDEAENAARHAVATACGYSVAYRVPVPKMISVSGGEGIGQVVTADGTIITVAIEVDRATVTVQGQFDRDTRSRLHEWRLLSYRRFVRSAMVRTHLPE